MRINRYVATVTGLGRRQVDKLILAGRVLVDDQKAITGQKITEDQTVSLDSKTLTVPEPAQLIMLNKPAGLVVSREGQGAPTIYSLVSEQYQNFKPVGRLDKNSSGLLLMTNDGQLINKLAHPSNHKTKIYSLKLNKTLTKEDQTAVSKGILLDDGMSCLRIVSVSNNLVTVSMDEGRNRQIRRTFEAIGYQVVKLQRTDFGKYKLAGLKSGQVRQLKI